MQVVHEWCGGLDVHKKTVVACVMTPRGKSIRSFATVTRDLLGMVDWLEQEQVTDVAMESTGVYWKPIFNMLESTEIKAVVANARQIKTVPGRKTDVKDAEWICDLHRHGLIRPSFIPERAQRELRELVRTRRTVIEQRADEVRRIHRLLEGANIKLGDVASDVMGVSGRAMLQALAAGLEDPAQLAGLARTSLRRKRQRLELALEGSVGPHLRFMLRHHLDQVQFLEAQIERLNVEIEQRMHPFDAAIEMLDRIPGLGRRSAESILAEIGIDMSPFPSDKHFSSWAKLCPGNNESAGKRRSGATGQGNPWLRSALVEAAWAASRNPDTYYGALYRRLATRRGKKRAIVAVAHALLIAIYHMLKDGTHYFDLGPEHFDKLDREAIARRSIRRLERLGFNVTITPAA
jgi:transposase